MGFLITLEAGVHYVAQAIRELEILVPPKFWSYSVYHHSWCDL
jgi:hypothetical protein